MQQKNTARSPETDIQRTHTQTTRQYLRQYLDHQATSPRTAFSLITVYSCGVFGVSVPTLETLRVPFRRSMVSGVSRPELTLEVPETSGVSIPDAASSSMGSSSSSMSETSSSSSSSDSASSSPQRSASGGRSCRYEGG